MFRSQNSKNSEVFGNLIARLYNSLTSLNIKRDELTKVITELQTLEDLKKITIDI